MPLLGLVGRTLTSGLGWYPISTNTAHKKPRFVLGRCLTTDGVSAPLVSKWAGILLKVECTNQSGLNKSMNLEKAQKLFTQRVQKRFDLDH